MKGWSKGEDFEKYIRKNPGALFIIFFQILLLFCSFQMIAGNLELAEDVAVYAFYTIVIGVALQLFSYIYIKDDLLLEKKEIICNEQKFENSPVKEEKVLSYPNLSVIIPAYNEEGTIKKTLNRLEDDLNLSGVKYEIIVVDDGSLDNTSNIVTGIANNFNGKVKYVSLGQNIGKGMAFKRGFQESKGAYILLRDADLETSPNLLSEYFKRIRSADVVIASKKHSESQVDYNLLRSFLSRSFNLIVNSLFDLGIDDTQCGFKLFRRDVLEKVMPKLTLKKYAFDVELLLNIKKNGFKIVIAPISLKNLRERTFRIKEIFLMGIDLVAVFYRLHFTKTYDSA